MDVGVCGQKFDVVRKAQFGSVERREVKFGLRADDAELVADNAGVPSHIDDAARAAFVVDQYCCRVFYREPMHDIRDERSGASGLAEEEVESVDAVRPGVEERAMPGERGGRCD